MSPAEWKHQKLADLRARIKIEEAILRSLRAELEEMQWLNQRATELRYGWDVVLSAEEQERREAEELFELIWILGEQNLKIKAA